MLAPSARATTKGGVRGALEAHGSPDGEARLKVTGCGGLSLALFFVLARIACGNSSGHRDRPPAKSVVFAGCAAKGAFGALAGNFSGHCFVGRWQKAWFLPAALGK